MIHQDIYRRGAVLLHVVLFSVLLAGCQDGFSSLTDRSLSSYDQKVNGLLETMTLNEKIGQMIQAENTGLKDITDIETYYIGSILSGGSSDPESGNSPEAWTDLYESLPGKDQLDASKNPVAVWH